MSQAVYPVVISKGRKFYTVRIPDFDAGTQGVDMGEAITMARDAIGLLGITLEDDRRTIPKPSAETPAHIDGEMVAWVDVDFHKYRLLHDQKTMRISVSIPRYLKVLGEEAGINFSGELQTRLKEVLRMA
jgi:predicted RNase H-like HicB family nuclease